MSEQRQRKLGTVEAVVRVEIIEGDAGHELGDWFEFAEPVITEDGRLATCRRKAWLVSQRFFPNAEPQ